MISLGIDIGGSAIKAAALREGQVLWTRRSPRYRHPDRDQLIAVLRQTCADPGESTGPIGLCVPGILEADGDRLSISVNMPGLVGISLSELIAAGTGQSSASPRIVNDAGATAFDIYCARMLSGRLLTIVIGTGVGMAVLDDGKPLMVDGGSPGHLGQIDVSLEGDSVIGPDGGRGSLEAYIGSAALRSRYGPDPASKIRPRDPAARALARAIRICHAIYRPHHVCIAGGTGIRLAHLVPDLRRLIEVDLTNIARPNWTLSAGDSDFHAALGAARIAALGAPFGG